MADLDPKCMPVGVRDIARRLAVDVPTAGRWLAGHLLPEPRGPDQTSGGPLITAPPGAGTTISSRGSERAPPSARDNPGMRNGSGLRKPARDDLLLLRRQVLRGDERDAARAHTGAIAHRST
jgi:hypothetical protein